MPRAARPRTRRRSGASARTTFSGRGVAIVAPVGPTRGSAAVYIDGAYRGDGQLPVVDVPEPRRDVLDDVRHARDAHDRAPRRRQTAGSTSTRSSSSVDVAARSRDGRSGCQPRDIMRSRSCRLAGRPGRTTVTRTCRGARDVEGGHPVRARDHPGQALPGDRVRRHDQLQHAPREGPVADPDEDLVPGRGRGRSRARDTVKGYEYAPDEYVVITDEDLEKVPAQDRPLDRDRAVHEGRRRGGREHPVRQAGLLPRARQDRPQGLRPAQGRSSRRRASRRSARS